MAMSRGTMFVVIYSLVILGLFTLFCYLMSTVNPKPLDPLPDGGCTPADARRDFNIGLSPDDAIGGDDEGLGYGLEKASESDKTAKPQMYADILPIYRHLLRTNGFVNSSLVQDVVPPRIPSLMRLSSTTKKCASKISMTREQPSVKGVRRSVNEMETKSKIDEESSRIILKIMDDSGRSRIEIKLGPNGLFEGNKLRRYENLANKSKTGNNPHEDESRVSVIKILPNNTMVFKDIDQSLVSLDVVKAKTLDYEDHDVKDLNSSITGNNTSARENEANYEEVILLDKTENMPKNKSSDVPQIYSLKMLIDNRAKSLNQPVKNGNSNDTFEKQTLIPYVEGKVIITDFKANDYNNYAHDEDSLHTLNDSQAEKPDNVLDNKVLENLQVM